MSAKVSFLSQPATDADQKAVIAVNPKAVVERDGKTVVFKVSGELVEAVPVSIGRKLGELSELTHAALKSGDRVVLNPPQQLKSGAKVTVASK